MSVPLNTRPVIGRRVWWRGPDLTKQDWIPAQVVRVTPAGLLTLDVLDVGRKERVQNGVKPGQWCGWADDLWLPREGGMLA